MVLSTSLFTHARALDEKPTYYSMELYSVTKGSEQGSLHHQIDSAMGLAQWRSVAWSLKFGLQFYAENVHNLDKPHNSKKLYLNEVFESIEFFN